MADSLDLSALQLLPEGIKRRILGYTSAAGGSDGGTPGAGDAPTCRATPGRPAGQAQPLAPPLAPPSVVLPQLTAGAAILDGTMSSAQVQAAVHEAEALLQAQGQATRMGGGEGKWSSSVLRGDVSTWLKRERLIEEGRRQLLQAMDLLAGLQPQLSAQG